MRRPAHLVILLAGSLSASIFCPQMLSQCGVERWSVKTGSDAGASSIDLTSSSPTTISTLTSLAAPQPIPPTSRVSPTETTEWIINATLVEFKLEHDSDYHLVITDDSGTTMIGEIPSPTCVDSASPLASAIAHARAQFDAVFTPSSSFQQANVPVQIKGVAMFDFLHGQTGVAQNGIEIHPVLDIVFNPNVQTGSLSVSASPASIGMLSGGTATTTVTTTTTGSFSSDVALSTSGLPTGLNASFASATIAAPGSGSSTLTLAADPSLATGNYSFAVTASGGGSIAQSSIGVNVCGVPPGPTPMALRAAPLTMARSSLAPAVPFHDDDDHRIQIVPGDTARMRYRHHGGDLLCKPRQYDVFVGTEWKTSAPARNTLSQVTARIDAAGLCRAQAQAPVPTVAEYSENVDSKFSDLRVQALLNSMIDSHKVPVPSASSLYVLFLDSSIQLTIGEKHGEGEFLAYNNHFHGDHGEVRYVVVPFDSNTAREKRTAARAILNTLANPEGSPW